MNIETSNIAMAGAQMNLRPSLTERELLKTRVSGERPVNISNELDVGTPVPAFSSLPPADAPEKAPPATEEAGSNVADSTADYKLPPMLFLIKRMMSPSQAAGGDDRALAREIGATVSNRGVNAPFSPFSLASAALHEAQPA